MHCSFDYCIAHAGTQLLGSCMARSRSAAPCRAVDTKMKAVAKRVLVGIFVIVALSSLTTMTQRISSFVILAKAGIHFEFKPFFTMDSRFRGNDGERKVLHRMPR